MAQAHTSSGHENYVVGLDLGNYSAGMVAVKVDDSGYPVDILSAVSHIHDGGVGNNNSKESRRAVSGVARRARRRLRHRREQRAAVDQYLVDRGFPLIEDTTGTRRIDPWEARSRLVNGVIADDDTFNELFSVAVRHISRHRGWRNPFLGTERLYGVTAPSDALTAAVEEAKTRYPGILIPDDATVGQFGQAVQQHVGNREKTRGTTKAVKIGESTLTEDTIGSVVEGSAKDKAIRLVGALSTYKLRQSDNARELERIFEVQRIDDPELTVTELIDVVFHQEPAKGAAESIIGKDALVSGRRRVWKADENYQCYRIAAQLANARVVDGQGAQRRLSVAERQNAFELLVDWSKKDNPTWSQIEEVVGLEPGQLKAPVGIEDDGEDLTGGPCINTTYRQLSTMTGSVLKPLREWFTNAEAEGREAMLYRLFSNVEQPSSIYDEEIDDLVAGLDTDGLEKLDGVTVGSGRGAYGSETCRELTEHILSTEGDLHDARRALYDVPVDWAPQAAGLTDRTGNASVDRTLGAVTRWLGACERRWGPPARITVENGRDGLTSTKTKMNRDKDAKRVAKRRREQSHRVAEAFGLDPQSQVGFAHHRKYDAMTRQKGQCFYCGCTVTMDVAEMDHIVPRSGPGSTTTRENLVATCPRCNADKSNQRASEWIRSSSIPGVSMEEVIDRIQHWGTSPGADPTSATKDLVKLKNAVISRVKRKTNDSAIDNRSVESMSWMSTEIRRRLVQHYADRGVAVTVATFGGATTAEARRTWVAGDSQDTAVSVNTMIEMVGGTGKVRLDRRHHALDAAVIAVMRPMVAEVLAQRRALRDDARLGMSPAKSAGTGVVYGAWRRFDGVDAAHKKAFGAWCGRMVSVIDLFQQALDTDSVHVTRNLRVRLGDGGNAATVMKNKRRKLHSKWSVDDVNRVADRRVWTALTRLPDFDWATGLPVNKQRSISVQGTEYGPKSRLEVMGSPGVAVRGGYVPVGSSYHHIRLHTFVDGRGRAQPYAERVFTHDLLSKHLRHQDLLTVELPPYSLSRRFSVARDSAMGAAGVVARRAGATRFVGSLLVGDELHMTEQDAVRLVGKGKLKALQEEIGPIACWLVKGLGENGSVEMSPYRLAEEGVEDRHCSVTAGTPAGDAMSARFRPALSGIFKLDHVRVIRRNALGEIREHRDGQLGSFTLVDNR